MGCLACLRASHPPAAEAGAFLNMGVANVSHKINSEDSGEDIGAELERRKVLRLGVYAAYTAPVLLAMATSAKAQSGSTGGVDCEPDVEICGP